MSCRPWARVPTKMIWPLTRSASKSGPSTSQAGMYRSGVRGEKCTNTRPRASVGTIIRPTRMLLMPVCLPNAVSPLAPDDLIKMLLAPCATRSASVVSEGYIWSPMRTTRGMRRKTWSRSGVPTSEPLPSATISISGRLMAAPP